MGKLISIVLPVYNVEKYLERCIYSIILQSYKNIEVIIINDGSTDNSLTICEKYRDIDSRIKIFTKDNGGLAAARNFGFEKVSGDYVTFVDSDDFISEYYVENLYNALKKTDSDMSISQFELYYCNSNNKGARKRNSNVQKIYSFNSEKALKEMFLQKKFDNSAWGKLYSKRLFQFIIYPEGKLYEDLPVTYKIISKANKIAFINTKDYQYVQRPESIQNGPFNEKKLDILPFIEEMRSFISSEYPLINNYVKLRAFNAYINMYKQLPKDDIFTRRQIWKLIKDTRGSTLQVLESRLKSKVASLLTYSGEKIFYFTVSKLY